MRAFARLSLTALAPACCVLAIAGTAGRLTTAAQARLAALPINVPAPAENPPTPQRVALGRLLFWDPIPR